MLASRVANATVKTDIAVSGTSSTGAMGFTHVGQSTDPYRLVAEFNATLTLSGTYSWTAVGTVYNYPNV